MFQSITDNTFIVATLNIVVPIIVLAALGFLLPRLFILLAYSIQRFRARLGEEKWANALEIVEFAVQAAEQAGIAAKLKDIALDKKEYALSHMEELAATHGLKGIDIRQWEVMIEGVLANYNWGKLFDNDSPRTGHSPTQVL